MKIRAKITEEPKTLRAERIKLVYDFLKHLTTLSSGALLVVAALAEKFFKESSLSVVLFAGMVFLLITILAAIVPMVILAVSVGRKPDGEATANAFAAGFLLAATSFFLGIGSIGYADFSQYR